ncbi:hypothetical protein LOZ86_08180 [Pectobacterium parvum]|uniref:Phytol kinase n=1 Tax=Pectobacterium parvum TaxID=2778550 RepID=A0AAP9LED6_9GAMM|nr:MULTISPECIES: hypothetical protein [Pectobacterium]QHQ26292.1 hypothetical protein GMX10_21360 [Pectobacterium parvum]UFK40790.1 hypothetical protein LOZ86_08180 [Pectobacterium parvum]
MSISIVLPIFVLVCSYWLLCSGLGLLAHSYDIKINYTRKIGHFSMFIFPGVIYMLFSISNPTDKIIIASLSSVLFFISLVSFFRDKLKYLSLSFYAIDRPEDRPYTLVWIFSQTFVGFVILALFSLLWNKWNIPQELMYMTILTTTLGDGLAEPVGIRFGKHKYAVKGFLIDRTFYRSYEGSLVVFVTALILALLFMQRFHGMGLAMMVILFPLAMTLTEAKSPHTWDTPFLFFVGNLIITCAYLI